MHERAIRRAAVATAAAVLLVAGGAFADTVAPNPDAITLDASGAVDLGVVAPGALVSVYVPLQLTCSPGAHVTNGASVNLSFMSGTVPLDGAVSAGKATIGPVSGFPDDGADCSSPPQVVSSGTPSHVTVFAPTTPNAPGTRYTYELMYLASTSDGDSAAVPQFVFVDLTLTVVGDLPPTLDLPGPMTVEGNTTGGADVPYTATASDPEDGALTPECAPSSGGFFPLGTTTVTCSVSDSGGHTVNGSFDVTVVDTTAPTFGSAPSVDLTTADASGTAAAYTPPSSSDIVDPSPTVVCVPAPGTLVAVGTTTVSCTATDATGNTASTSFPLTVTYVPPVSGGTATFSVVFDEPIGSASQVVINPGRTLPVKATVLDGVVAVTTGAVDLAVTACGSETVLDGPVAMTLQNDRWVVGLDTTGLPACTQGTVRLDGQAVGSFEMDSSASSLSKPVTKGQRTRP